MFFYPLPVIFEVARSVGKDSMPLLHVISNKEYIKF